MMLRGENRICERFGPKESMMSTTIYEHVRGLTKSLAPHEQLRLVGEIVGDLSEAAVRSENGLTAAPEGSPRPPYRSLWGTLKHLGPAPSAEDIDEVRREEWKNFPREDI